nr:MAG: hypothetical protein [Microvirus sp.]
MIAYQLISVSDGRRTGLVTSENLKEATKTLSGLLSDQKISGDDLFLAILESADNDDSPENVAFSSAPLLKVSSVVDLFPSESN